MPEREYPEWFVLAEKAFDPTHRRIAAAVQDHGLPVHLSLAPQEAVYFFIHSLQIAQDTNKAGIHANSLAQTRYCIEALSIMELGICKNPKREEVLQKWLDGKASPGNLRQWLAKEVWPAYGSGLWTEPWETFMAKLAGAVQPYAHYTAQLAQWQSRLHFSNPADGTAYIESGPMVYDPQKATRITLYHAILGYALGRIWCAHSPEDDQEFKALVAAFGRALGKSRYLDGHKTEWDQIFWSMLCDSKTSSPILE